MVLTEFLLRELRNRGIESLRYIVEYGIQGRADCLLREELGWDDHDGYRLELRRNLALITERDLVWS